MARFVPNVLTADALKRLGIPEEKFAADFPKMVKAGLDRLGTLQNPDGGWGWFDKDSSDPFMTACAVSGLSEAKRLGHAVDSVMLERGEECARALAKAEQDPNRLAYLCLALSRGKAVDDARRLVDRADSLSPYALAATALSLQRWGRPEAAALRSRLGAGARQAHWATSDWNHKWENVAVETTSLAVIALAEAEPDHPALAPAVEWLLAQRSGNRWRSTKDTAAAIHAILAHAVATGGRLDALGRAVEGQGKRKGSPEILKKARLTLNGVAKEYLVDLNDPTACRFEVHFAGSDLKTGENRIEAASEDNFEFDIEGTLRTTGVPPPAGTNFSILSMPDRPYDVLRLGDELTVSVAVTASAEYDYVMVEVPVPAGCEVIPGSGDGPHSRFEARHEQAIFYLRSCGPAPTTLRFKIRCAFAGRYTTLAPYAEVMYDAGLSGRGVAKEAVIGP